MTHEELLQRIATAARKEIHFLDLSNKDLTSLPPEIGQLKKLEVLVLNGNKLTDLPPEIELPENLKALSLARNQLARVPPQVWRLKKLGLLHLFSNNLTSLPPEIGQLKQLRELVISNNKLTTLPPEIGQLTNLRELNASLNQLAVLPVEIAQLTNLAQLYLEGNPLPIPPEILERDYEPSVIINYYLKLQKGEQRKALNEAKMLVVGQGSVGKTSLVKRLMKGEFNPDENKTEGIDIQRWRVQVNGHDVRLNVWDFGGQEIMHATHQFFLTKRSVYLLVVDARLGEEENRIEYWLKMIQSFGGDSPVIIVGNKIDQQALDLDRRGLQTKYPNIKAFVETSCRNGGGLEELRSTIIREVGALEHIHDELLTTWFAVKTRLEEMKEDYIPYSEYVRLCHAEKVSDDTSQHTLIRFLHDLGIVLNFQDDPRLEDTNILNPEWVTNGVYKILNSNELFQNKGVLERRTLNQILDPREYPKDKHLFIMDMMRKFELCFDFEGFTDQKFLIPDLLSKEEPYTGDWRGALALEYHYNVLPGSVISRFIVRMHPFIHQNTSWRTGVVLEHEGSMALVKADIEDGKIFISVKGPELGRRTFLSIIRSHFDSIHKTIPGIAAAAKVPLPGKSKVVVDYKHLLRLEELGEPTFIPEGLSERVEVKRLLNGLETEQSRREQRERHMLEEGREAARAMLMPRPSAPHVAQTDESGVAQLKKIKANLDANSERHARRYLLYGLGLLAAVWGALAVLTYLWGWNAMEPWTFFVPGAVPAVAYAYFAITQKEFSPTAIYTHLVERKQRQLYEANGFDLKAYERLAGQGRDDESG